MLQGNQSLLGEKAVLEFARSEGSSGGAGGNHDSVLAPWTGTKLRGPAKAPGTPSMTSIHEPPPSTLPTPADIEDGLAPALCTTPRLTLVAACRSAGHRCPSRVRGALLLKLVGS